MHSLAMAKPLSSSFGRQFKLPSRLLSETDVQVSRKPRSGKRNKFSLSEFKSSEKFFWEELKDGQQVVPRQTKASKPLTATPTDSLLGIEFSAPEAISVVTIQSSDVARNPAGQYLEASGGVLELSPSVLVLQQDLIRAREVTDLLLLFESNADRMDSVNVSTCLHRIAKLESRGRRKYLGLTEDTKFGNLLTRVGSFLNSDSIVGPVWLSNVLWAVVKLDVTQTAWFPSLITLTTQAISKMDLEHVGCTLFCVAELQQRKKNISTALTDLGDLLVAAAASRPPPSNHHQLVSICTSLARIGRAEKSLFRAMSDSVLRDADQLSMSDLASVLWAFTAVGLTDSQLISRTIQTLEKRVSLCSKRNLVDFAWALAKSKSRGNVDFENSADLTELFRFTLAPAIRAQMMDLTVREMCTVVWSFATAEVSDSNFFNDLSVTLIPSVSHMNVHDVSSLVWAFGSLGFQHAELGGKIRSQALRLKTQFSPLQLSRVIYGLGVAGGGDKRVLSELTESAKRCMHLLLTQNIVEILIGLKHGGLLGDRDLLADFLAVLEKQTHRLSGRDSVQILSVLSAVPTETSVQFSSLVRQLEELVAARFNCQGRWIPTGFDLIDLISAMGALRINNPELAQNALLHLSTVYKSPSFTADIFVSFLQALTNAQSAELKILTKQLLLRKSAGIQTALAVLTDRIMRDAHLLTPDGAVELLSLFAKIEYCDPHVERLAERLVENFDRVSDWGKKVSVIASFTQLGMLPDWTFAEAEKLSLNEPGSVDSSLDLIWARLAMGDEPIYIPQNLLTRVNDAFVETGKDLPKNIFRAKQVVLSVGEESWTDFANEVRAVRKNRRLGKVDKFSSLVAHNLTQLGVKHKHECSLLGGLYSVTASIAPFVCVDIADAGSVITPSGSRFSGDKILKNIHLAKAGWTVLNLRMAELQIALENQSLKAFLADVIAPFNEKGKARVSFRKLTAKNDLMDDVIFRD